MQDADLAQLGGTAGLIDGQSRISTEGKFAERGELRVSEVTNLLPGRFYWVLVRSSTTDAEWQPARFLRLDSSNGPSQWSLIGFNADLASYFVEVADIGAELLRPAAAKRERFDRLSNHLTLLADQVEMAMLERPKGTGT